MANQNPEKQTEEIKEPEKMVDSSSIKFLQALPCSPPSPFFIGQLQSLNDANKIIFNTEFQRGEVWDTSRKQKLIDSIIRGYNINTIFLRQLSDGRYECLDGQQRLKTILQEFLKDKFPINPKITPEFKDKTHFSDLHEYLRNKILTYPVYAVILYTVTDEETCKVFLRLQEGLPLNAAEKLNAMIGFLRNEIVDLTTHPFFSEIGIRNYRFAHRYIIAQMYMMTLKDQITDVKFAQLQELYTAYQHVHPPEQNKKRIIRILNLLNKEFGAETKLIRRGADFISFYLLAKHILDNYATNEITLNLKEFYREFIVKITQVQSSEGLGNAPYYDYKTYRKTSSDSRISIQKRTDIVISKFLEYNPTLVPKDPIRNFDEWERIAIYHKGSGICQICDEVTPFDKGDADHILPHSKGGFTTIENGQWLCKLCNQKKLAKL